MFDDLLEKIKAKVPDNIKEKIPFLRDDDEYEDDDEEYDDDDDTAITDADKVREALAKSDDNENEEEDEDEEDDDEDEDEEDGEDEEDEEDEISKKDKKRKKIIYAVVGVTMVLFMLPDEEEKTKKAPQSKTKVEKKKAKKAKSKRKKVAKVAKKSEIKPLEIPTPKLIEKSAPKIIKELKPVVAIPTAPPIVPIAPPPKAEIEIAAVKPKIEMVKDIKMPTGMEIPVEMKVPSLGEGKTTDVNILDGNENILKMLQGTNQKVVMPKIVGKKTILFSPPPDYEQIGRGLVYNCAGKFWACVDRKNYFKCKNNKKWSTANFKSLDCVDFDVYSTEADCATIQVHNINIIKSTAFCSIK